MKYLFCVHPPQRQRAISGLLLTIRRCCGGRALGALVAVFSATGVAQAQPANNAFASAWTLSGASVSTNGNSANASKETGEPNHAGNAGARSVWFNWIAPRDGQ